MANKYYLSACEALPADKRACLAKADHPAVGLHRCQAHDGAKKRRSPHAARWREAPASGAVG